MGEIQFDEQRGGVKTATLDLYHLYSQQPGWDLEVELDGPNPQLSITGTGQRPALPGPSPLEVAYIDHPSGLTVARSELVIVEIGRGNVRITGTLHVTCAARESAIRFDIEAALVT